MKLSKTLAIALVIVVAVSGLGSVLLLDRADDASKGNASPDVTYSEDRTARLWVDLTSLSGGAARAEDRWGSVETFSEAALGTTSSYRSVSLSYPPQVDTVVLDGYVWSMVNGDSYNAAFLRYSPEVTGASWNISFEVYSPQGADYFDPTTDFQQIGLTATLVNERGAAVAAADLSYGSPGQSWVRVTDAAGTSYHLSDRIIPPDVYRSGSEGTAPQRYIVSFQHVDGGGCNVTVYHTSGVVVGRVQVAMPSGWGTPDQLVLSTTSHVQNLAEADQHLRPGAWVLDNFACRGATARYPMAGPLYEYAGNGTTVPVKDASLGSEQNGAIVTIGGTEAAYNATTGRYEADLPLDVQWNKRVDYSVELDGVELKDRMSVTMYSSTEHAAVSTWWNGWDWVSVFGEDDCNGPETALNTYARYNHPVTAYVMSISGNSGQVLPRQSEIALHNPHYWQTTGQLTWAEAEQMAADGMSSLVDYYDYASRWDDPANGGSGDTYISMANPGNRATYQLMYALFEAGIRIDGRSSDGSGAPGNHSQIGSWYSPSSDGGGWYPYTPIDLMDASRSLSWDYPRSWSSLFQQVDNVARNQGVLRVYGHSNEGPVDIPGFLHWIDDPKTNYSLENWKATDGEVASYVYGRWSTNVRFNQGASDAGRWTFNVTTADPKAAGYWDVPVTVAIDLGGRTVKDVIVQDGEHTYRLSDGTMRDLRSGRIMDTGCDVRDGVLYVSECWGPSATVTVVFADLSSAGTLMGGSTVEMVIRDP